MTEFSEFSPIRKFLFDWLNKPVTRDFKLCIKSRIRFKKIGYSKMYIPKNIRYLK